MVRVEILVLHRPSSSVGLEGSVKNIKLCRLLSYLDTANNLLLPFSPLCRSSKKYKLYLTFDHLEIFYQNLIFILSHSLNVLIIQFLLSGKCKGEITKYSLVC